jgi:hypothetical protein
MKFKDTKKTYRNQHNKTMKKMNCSPSVKGKTKINGSCFTDDVLYKLKKSYNHNYPNHKIKEKEPVKQPVKTPTTYVDKHGKQSKMDTTNIGKKPKPKDKPADNPQPTGVPDDYDEDEEKIRELCHTIEQLAEENTILRDKIAIGQWNASEIEKIDIEETVANLREQLRVLEIDNKALRESRDMYQNRYAEAVKMYQKRHRKQLKLSTP